MVLYNKEIRFMIKRLESSRYFPKFPRELREYLSANYLHDESGEHDWKLDVTVKPPVERAMAEIQYMREIYADLALEKVCLKSYIDELHEFLWSHGLEGSRMLHDESGEHKGTYAEFSTLFLHGFE